MADMDDDELLDALGIDVAPAKMGSSQKTENKAR